MHEFLSSSPFLGVAVVVIILLLISFVASRYKVAGANEAIIVAGSRGAKVHNERGQVISSPGDKGVKVVVGGGTIVMPLINRVGRLKLTARQINVQLSDAVTSQGIKVQVQGVATFKIGRDVESLRNAAARFLDAKPEQVDSIVKNVLEGSLRSIVGTLTIEELIGDRQKLLQQVQDAAKGDLATSGLQIDAFTIQSFSDESNYIELLGQQSVATVSRDARMAKASTDQEAAVREAEAQQIKINAARDVSLREAETRTQVQAAQARADQSGPLAQAEATQEVVRKQTELAQLPDTVRAAAEPMSHIDSLTVMSADGASDIVKNATRAMIESTTAIKGLTGLDVPSLVGGALGRGFGEKLRTGEGNGDASRESATDRISQIAGEGLATLKARAAAAAASTEAAAEEVEAKVDAAAAKVQAAADQTAAAVQKAASVTAPKVAAAAKAAPTEGNLVQWAKWLADQLRRVPDIQVYDALRLADLESRGPVAARGVWATAKQVLAKEYGTVTIGELLKRF